MPLEQIRGQARPASDLYALGVTMVVALAGRPPEQLEVDESTGKIAIERAVPPETPPVLRDVLDGMIAVVAGQRIPSASDVLRRLGSGAGGVPRLCRRRSASRRALVMRAVGLQRRVVRRPARVRSRTTKATCPSSRCSTAGRGSRSP